jgi:hypothetical protein
MRADMSDESTNESLVKHTQPGFDIMSDDARIARMEVELATLLRVLLVLAEDKLDLLRLLGHSPANTVQDRS